MLRFIASRVAPSIIGSRVLTGPPVTKRRVSPREAASANLAKAIAGMTEAVASRLRRLITPIDLSFYINAGYSKQQAQHSADRHVTNVDRQPPDGPEVL